MSFNDEVWENLTPSDFCDDDEELAPEWFLYEDTPVPVPQLVVQPPQLAPEPVPQNSNLPVEFSPSMSKRFFLLKLYR